MNKSSKFSRRILFFNSFYNFVGKIIPLLVAFITIPIIIHKMGVDRFGILALAWTFIGYFGVFDLGLGRATTKYTAEYLALNRREELLSLIWTSWWMLFSLGILGALAGFLAVPVLIERILNIPPLLSSEARQAFMLISISIPIIFSTAGMRGVLEAQQRFGLINAISVPAGISNFLAPLPILFFYNSLVPVVLTTVIIRIILWFIFFFFAIRSIPDLIKPRLPSLIYLRSLFSFGSWITVSNMITPIMANMDRFFIGSILTMKDVAYYTTPFDVVSRLSIVSTSIISVLFPAFSASGAVDRTKLEVIFDHSVRYVFIIMTLLVTVVIILARPFLNLWIGSEFALQSTAVLQILALGVLIRTLGDIPYAAIQAIGRPDLTAKLHLLELPFYLGGIFFLIKYFGIVGVALAWTLRVSLNTALLYWCVIFLKIIASNILLKNYHFLAIISIVMALYIIPSMTMSLNIISSILLIIMSLSILSYIFWRYIITNDDKLIILSNINNITNALINHCKDRS